MIELHELPDQAVLRVRPDVYLTRVSLHTVSGCQLEAETTPTEADTLRAALTAAWTAGWRP